MALVGPDRQSASWKSLHGSPVILGVNLATICDNQSTRKSQLRPFGSVKFLKLEKPATSWFPITPTLYPYRSSSGIGKAKKKLSKMVGNSTTV